MRPPLPVAILAGGLATRLGALTQRVPKALLEINGEPFLAHQLRLLERQGIRRVVLCVGHLGESIREFAGAGERFGMELAYSFDGPSLRGTAGAIHQALPLLGDPFFVMYGDSYLPCDFSLVQSVFEDSGKQALMTVYPNSGRWDASNVEFAEGRIRRYDKRAPTGAMRYIDYGLGVFRQAVFEAMTADAVRDLAEVYQDLLARGELAACEVSQRFYEIGSVAGMEDLSRALRNELRASSK